MSAFKPTLKRPILHRVNCRHVGQEIPAGKAMPFVRVHPSPSDPLDLRRVLKALPPMPVREIGKEGAP